MASSEQPEPQCEDYDDGGDYDAELCPTCGGDGVESYLDAGPSAWGEDCPSEMDHLITCTNCKGTGLWKDCSTW